MRAQRSNLLPSSPFRQRTNGTEKTLCCWGLLRRCTPRNDGVFVLNDVRCTPRNDGVFVLNDVLRLPRNDGVVRFLAMTVLMVAFLLSIFSEL
ncbi:MAG: hypothetical protein LBE13_19560 [Bacteroidales bacterium]|nr:hypothetical protein [Bacteroidales bacterium]